MAAGRGGGSVPVPARHEIAPPCPGSPPHGPRPVRGDPDLRMPVAGKMAADALLHQPDQEPGPAAGRLRVPPWHTVVHQHRFGHAVGREDSFQLFAHRLSAGRTGLLQRHQIAAVVVEHRQRPDRRLALLGPLEVHLPAFVRALPLETLRCRASTVVRQHQAVPQQDPMHGDHRQLLALSFQQDRQLPCSPVGPLPAPCHDPRFDLRGSLPRTGPGTAAAFFHTLHTALAKPSHLQMTRRTRDAVLPAKPKSTRPGSPESQTQPVDLAPPSPSTTSQPPRRQTRHGKDLLITTCKECHETEHKLRSPGTPVASVEMTIFRSC